MTRTLRQVGILLLGMTAVAEAQPAGKSESVPVEETTYRVIHAPLEKIFELTRGQEEYRKMNRQDFFARVQALQQEVPDAVAASVTIRQATYSARLEGTALVAGRAILEVDSLSESLTVLSLDPMNLALESSTWTTPGETPAILGSTPNGPLILLVPQSGTLQLNWSRQANRDRPDELDFELRFPPCPSNRLELTLPAEYALTSSAGIIQSGRTQEANSGSVTGSNPTHQWVVDLGGQNVCRLQLRRADRLMPTTWLHQVDNYEVSETGLELASELHLDCQQPLSRLALQVDPPLRLTQVRCNDQAVSWTSSQDEDDAIRSVVLTFPKPIQGSNRIVSILAMAPLPEPSSWKLPRIGVQQVQWEQQIARIQFVSPLELSDLKLDQAQRIPTRDSDVLGGSVVSIQSLTPNGQIELEIQRPSVKYAVTSGTTVRLTTGDAEAEIRAHVQPDSAELFELTAEVARGWNVVSIEAEDRELIHDWQIRSSPTAPRQLEVRFAHPLDPRTPAQLRIQARRQISIGADAVPLAELRPLRFSQGVRGFRHFLAVLPEENLRTRYTRDDRTTWLSLDDLDNIEAQLVTVQARDPILSLGNQEPAPAVALEPLPPDELPFTAVVQITAELSDAQRQERYRLIVDRSAASAGPLQVRVSPPRQSEIRWFSEQNPQRTLPARKLSPDDDTVGETWEIDWPEPSETAWVIRGERTFPYENPAPISLLRVLGARSQEGTVTIVSPAVMRLDVEHSPLLVPIPSGHGDSRTVGPSHRTFRLTSSTDAVDAQQGLRVRVASTIPSTAQPPLCIWRCTLESQLDPSGRIGAQALVQLENQGAADLSLRLPSECRLLRVLINGSEAKYLASETGQLVIPLPERERFPVLQLIYEVPDRPLSWLRSVSLPQPEWDVPVVDQQSLVWIPPSYVLRDGTQAAENGWNASLRRLFGPLLRPADEQPFDLFSRADWIHLFRGTVPAPTVSPTARQWIVRLGKPSTTRWSDVIPSSDGPPERSVAETVWIDESRLAARGIIPSATVPNSTQTTDYGRGIHRLQQAHLVLLQMRDGLVLTTADLLGLWATKADLLGADCIADLGDQTLQGDSPLPSPASSLDLVPASAWSDQFVPWKSPPPDAAPYAVSGWQLHVTSPTPHSFQLYRRDIWLVASCALFLACMAVGGWLSHARLRLVILLLLVIAILAVVLPAPFGPWGPAAWWGFIAGLLLRLCARRADTGEAQSEAASTPSDSRRLSVPTMVIAWLIFSAATVSAQTTDESGNPDPATYDLYLPTDETALDDLYVPRSLRIQLLEQMQLRQGRLTPWILPSAEYRATLIRRTPSRTALETLTAEYELYVPESNLPLRLPLAADTIAALERDGRLDGRPVRLEWLADSSMLMVPVSQAGPHRLQVNFRPVAKTLESGTMIDLPIPPAPRAHLTLQTPDRSGPVEIATALGAVRSSDTAGPIQAELGPTDRLVIRWDAPTRTATAPVEQLSWLRIAPEQVRLDVRFRIDTGRWRAETILIEADERLQLDGSENAQPISLGPARVDGFRLLQFAVETNGIEQTELDLHFVMTGWSGIGRLRLPRCRILEQPDVSHWLGVTAHPRLLVQNESPREEAERRQATEFAAKWGDESVPEQGFRLQGPQTQWVCTSMLRDATTQAEIQTVHEIFPTRSRFIALANLTTQNGNRFQQRLRVPSSLKLQSVSFLRQSESRPVRWSKKADGSVTLIYDQPASGSYQLILIGELDDLELGPRRLERLQLLDCNLTKEELFIYRGSDVLLSSLPNQPDDATRPQLATLLTSSLDSTPPERSREYAAISLNGEPNDPVIEVQQNQPKISAQLINVVTRQQGDWYHQWEVRMQLEQGILDGLWLEIPRTWVARLQMEQMRVFYGGESPETDLARVIIWPPDPWEPGQPIWFSFDPIPIPVTSGEPVSVPNIRLLERTEIERYLYLPTEIESQPVLWTTSGLEPDEAGPNPPPTIAASAEYQCFRIREENFQAIRLPGRTIAGQPRVRLADVHQLWDSPDHFYGFAFFDLEPGGVTHCEVHLEESLKPLRVDVEDRPAIWPAESSPTSVRLDLMSDELPQRISVLYEGRRPEQTPHLAWRPAVPTLRTVPPETEGQSQTMEVAESLWTVYFPPQLRCVFVPPTTAGPAPQTVTPAELELQRLAHLAKILDRTQEVATDFTRSELDHWYSHWGPRFHATQRRAERLLRTHPSRDQNRLMTELVTQQRTHGQAVEKLEVVEVDESLQRQPDSLDEISVWQQALVSPVQTQSWRSVGWHPSPPIRMEPEVSTSPPRSWIAVVLLAIAGGVIATRIDRTALESLGWKHAAGVLAGIAWWLWLQPSIFGWLIVGISLLLLVRQRPPTRQVRQ